jgi:hypothetical protein
MKMKKLSLPLICAAALGFAGPALAEDFTFTVPVQLTNLPTGITGFNVQCSVLASQVWEGRTIQGRSIGSGATYVHISGGSYSGDVTVAFNHATLEDPHLAVFYGCAIQRLDGPSPTGGGSFSYYPGLPHFIPLAAGAPFVASVNGSLPPG